MSKHEGVAKIDIFISFRYKEAENEALLLKDHFEKKGLVVFVCPKSCPGIDLVPMIAKFITMAKLVILLKSRTFGLKTDSFGYEIFREDSVLNYSMNFETQDLQ